MEGHIYTFIFQHTFSSTEDAVIIEEDNLNEQYIALNRERGRVKPYSVDPRKAGREVGKVELLLSPGQLLWRDESSDKYYMLST